MDPSSPSSVSLLRIQTIYGVSGTYLLGNKGKKKHMICTEDVWWINGIKFRSWVTAAGGCVGSCSVALCFALEAALKEWSGRRGEAGELMISPGWVLLTLFTPRNKRACSYLGAELQSRIFWAFVQERDKKKRKKPGEGRKAARFLVVSEKCKQKGLLGKDTPPPPPPPPPRSPAPAFLHSSFSLRLYLVFIADCGK